MNLTIEPNNSESFNNALFSVATSQQLKVVQNFVQFCDGIFDLKQGNKFRDHLLNEKGLAPATVSTHLFRLKGTVRKLLKISSEITNAQKYLIEEALKDIKAPKKASRAITEDKILSEEEINLLIEYLPPQTSLIVEVLKYTGCRISEVLDIKITDICEKEEKIALRIMGKGMKVREVFIPKELWTRLSLRKGENFIFETKNGKQVDRKYINLNLKRQGKKLFPNKNITPHMFRHSFATQMLKKTKGQKLSAVSKYLGHSSSSVTLDFYVHDQLTEKELFGF